MHKNLEDKLTTIIQGIWSTSAYFKSLSKIQWTSHKLLWVKVGRMYLWSTILLLNDGQWQFRALLLIRWRQTWWATWFSWRSTRDWPLGSKLCLLLCSWSNWQLLAEVLFNTHPATGVPLSAETWDVWSLCDTLPGLHTCRGLGCAAGQEQQGLGHRVLARTKPQRTALRQEKQPSFGWCGCLGGFCWCGCQDFAEDVHIFQSEPKEAPELEAKALTTDQKHCLG